MFLCIRSTDESGLPPGIDGEAEPAFGKQAFVERASESGRYTRRAAALVLCAGTGAVEEEVALAGVAG
jgi:hypothetical protein